MKLELMPAYLKLEDYLQEDHHHNSETWGRMCEVYL